MRKALLIAASISILSILALVLLTFNEETIHAIRHIVPEYLLAAVGAHLLGYVFWGMRTSLLSRGMGYRVSVVRCTSIVLHSLLLSAITPSMMGGEPVRIHMLKTSGVPYGRASVVVLGERILDVLFFIVAIPVVILTFHLLGVASFFLLLTLSALMLVGLVLLIAYGLRNPYRLRRLVAVVAARVLRLSAKLVGMFRRNPSDAWVRHIVERVDAEVRAFNEGLRELLRQGRGHVAMAYAATIGYWLSQYSVVVWVLLGLVRNVSIDTIIMAYAAQIVLSMVMVLPLTPGASGVAEVGALALFGSFAPASVVGVLVLGWRAVHYYFDVLFSALYNLSHLNRLMHAEDMVEE
ncbi:MAG: flippase-like domain-containing protein [Methermicoccaceae archaeon]